jgi:hypothetical protein
MTAGLFRKFVTKRARARRRLPVVALEANEDGVIDEAVRNTIAVDPSTGLTPEGLTRDQALAARYPNFPG